MNILHYTLGLPPYRTGGLTKFSVDLMTAQLRRGDKVYALWPGEMKLMSGAQSVRRRKTTPGICSLELINPLPVPLDEGISDPSAFMQPGNEEFYLQLLQELSPRVLHIHTLMGLHRELITAAHKAGVRTVFTTHDYFGICPKVTLFRGTDVCPGDMDCISCVGCNRGGLSMGKIRLLQSPLYRGLKDSPPVRLMRKKHRGGFFYENTDIPQEPSDEAAAQEYRRLREYYLDILAEMDMIHFNSSVSEGIYQKYFTPKASRVVSITNGSIADIRGKARRMQSDKLRLLYLAPAKRFKGFEVMLDALDQLWEGGKRNFSLKVFGAVPRTAAYMEAVPEGFTPGQLPDIFSEADVLLAPSVWYETFGFTVIEALSCGVPVIVSDRVGAGDVAGDGGIVVKAGDTAQLKEAVQKLMDRETLKKLQKNASALRIKTMEELLPELDDLYKEGCR